MLFCSDGVCPIFKTYRPTYYPDKFAEREIQELKVICQHKKNGCEWSDSLRHLEVCFYISDSFFLSI